MSDKTAQVLHDMLTENTGRSILDSGSAYGRHWERNQCRAFENEPETSIHACVNGKYSSIEATINVYHWLKSRLEYCEEKDREFYEFATSEEYEDLHWLGCMEAWMEKLVNDSEDMGDPIGGIYGEGNPITVNTYNEEENLSQILQFTYWESGDGAYVLLQIHGGCDVRGGYTAPHVFEVSNYSELCMFDYQKYHIYCTNENADHEQTQFSVTYKDPDCYNHWDYHGSSCEYIGEENDCKDNLEDLEFVDFDDYKEMDEDEKADLKDKDYVLVKDGIPHCPSCGSPLSVGYY